MCFRPPSIESGESVCPGCFVIVPPDGNGKCPECGASMSPETPSAPAAAPTAPKAPGAPSAPKASGTPPKAPGV